jgi:hypothetical protein
VQLCAQAVQQIGLVQMRQSKRAARIAEIGPILSHMPDYPVYGHDYSLDGCSICSALVQDHINETRNERGHWIRWGDRWVRGGDWIAVPKHGIVRAEFLSWKGSSEQGVDLDVDTWILLAGGEKVPLLRTPRDDRYEDIVEYEYKSTSGYLRTWNYYEYLRPDGNSYLEKWTGNAGLWAERLSEHDRIYHCSAGGCDPPDFDHLVYRVTVRPFVSAEA